MLKIVDVLYQAMEDARDQRVFEKIIPLAGMAAEYLERYRDSTHVHVRNSDPASHDLYGDDDDDDDPEEVFHFPI